MTVWQGVASDLDTTAWLNQSVWGWRRHDLRLRDWAGPALRIAVLADLHVHTPNTPVAFVADVVRRVNAMAPDLILLAGDVLSPTRFGMMAVSAADTVAVLDGLTAPRGVFAILGNHDWKDCPRVAATQGRENSVITAFAQSHIPLLVNEAVDLGDLWLVGLDSQRPYRRPKTGRHDPDAAFAHVPKGAPTLLLAHEPDYFAVQDPRAQVQISGHTHGGQANLWGWRPLTPSRYRGRYAYGHHVDGNRHLVVSGGSGFSGLPYRFRQPTEVTLITITGDG